MSWKERLKKLAPRVGYPIFYLFALLFFLSWTFPYEKLKERIVATFNAQQRTSSSPQTLEIDDLDSSFVTGVKAKGVRLKSPAPDGKTAIVAIDEARARISLLGLIAGNRDVSFKIDAFDGTIKGEFEDSGKARSIDMDFDGVELKRVDAIAANIGFPLEGKLYGSINLDLPEGKASKASGTVNLEIRDAYAGDAKELKVKTPMGPFTLPRLKVGTLTIAGEAKDGVLKITKLSGSGGDVDVGLVGDARVQLRELATDSRLEATVKFKVNDSYRTKSDVTKLLFGNPGSKEKPLMEMKPEVARSKTSDGFYSLKVGGTLGKPDVVPGVGTPSLSSPK